jgi:hypothetical protein
VTVCRPIGLVAVHVSEPASNWRVHVLPLRFVCSRKVARRQLTSFVTLRVVLCTDVRPEGVVVVTDGIGDRIPKPTRGSGVSAVAR